MPDSPCTEKVTHRRMVATATSTELIIVSVLSDSCRADTVEQCAVKHLLSRIGDDKE